MGQDISAIITKGHVVVPESIVHFKEWDSTIIPLDLDAEDVSSLIEKVLEFDDFSLFIQFLKENDFMFTVEDDEDDPYQRTEWIPLIDLIEGLNVKSWAIEHYSEFGGNIAEHHFMPVIEGAILKEACSHRWNEDDHIPIRFYQEKMGINPGWIADEKRYFSFGCAKREYNLLKEQGKA